VKASPRRLAAALALLAAGCAGSPARPGRPMHPPAPPVRAGAPPRSAGPGPGSLLPRKPPKDPGARAVAAAQALVGEREVVVGGVDYGAGCLALVRAALDAAGRPLPPGTRDAAGVHALAVSRQALKPLARASPGDVVFLADRPGGTPEHVGLVARVEPDGTAVVLHRTARGVVPLRLNGTPPGRRAAPEAARRSNDALLVNGRAIPAGSLALGAADLLRG
jgi:hypothetical protein